MNGHQSFDEKQPPQHMNYHLVHAHEYQPFRLKQFQPEPTTPRSLKTNHTPAPREQGQ